MTPFHFFLLFLFMAFVFMVGREVGKSSLEDKDMRILRWCERKMDENRHNLLIGFEGRIAVLNLIHELIHIL